MIKAVIFDMDGTLVDTNPAHVEAWRASLADHGHEVPESRIKPEIGKGGDNFVPSVLGEEGERHQGESLRAGHGQNFRRLARQQSFRLFPGVRELLAEL